jgi:hypothetical protein
LQTTHRKSICVALPYTLFSPLPNGPLHHHCWGLKRSQFPTSSKTSISMFLSAVGCPWGPVILTFARIGSPGPGRFPYSHCSWASLRPSDSGFGQNWKPGTGEIPLLSLQLGVLEAQWFWLLPELEARDLGDSPTLTAVGHPCGPVILTFARIGSPGPGRFPYSHCSCRTRDTLILGRTDLQWQWNVKWVLWKLFSFFSQESFSLLRLVALSITNVNDRVNQVY